MLSCYSNFGLVYTDDNTGQNSNATPILLYLDSPSTLSVYKSDQLISVQELPAGNQYLDTSSFPIGAYQLKIKIRDQYMHERSLSNFFVDGAFAAMEAASFATWSTDITTSTPPPP